MYKTELYKLLCNDSWTKLLHCICRISVVPTFSCVSPISFSLDSPCIDLTIVLLISHYTSVICILFVSLESKCLALICGHIFANMYKFIVIVIDKPIGLGGTVYASASIFMSHQCTIYHQNKSFETNTEW